MSSNIISDITVVIITDLVFLTTEIEQSQWTFDGQSVTFQGQQISISGAGD